jgi:hypothetical protein
MRPTLYYPIASKVTTLMATFDDHFFQRWLLLMATFVNGDRFFQQWPLCPLRQYCQSKSGHIASKVATLMAAFFNGGRFCL